MAKQIIKTTSSQMVEQFLERNGLHKKDFAQMIGVTLSYVYNLIDNAMPFSTRTVTLERIATVMEVKPENFEEYKIPQEPILIDKNVEMIKGILKSKKMSTVNFLKAFPRNKRLEMVDILRGALPLPIDYKQLNMIGQILGMSKDEIFNIWSERIKQVLSLNGMDIYGNSTLIDAMLECAQKVNKDKI
ncbi:helix-turn-helix transcriptional regulator [bacterium]|nr:helix-turn-helix transcriptional regulator [bacterium]